MAQPQAAAGLPHRNAGFLNFISSQNGGQVKYILEVWDIFHLSLPLVPFLPELKNIQVPTFTPLPLLKPLGRAPKVFWFFDLLNFSLAFNLELHDKLNIRSPLWGLLGPQKLRRSPEPQGLLLLQELQGLPVLQGHPSVTKSSPTTVRAKPETHPWVSLWIDEISQEFVNTYGLWIWRSVV